MKRRVALLVGALFITAASAVIGAPVAGAANPIRITVALQPQDLPGLGALPSLSDLPGLGSLPGLGTVPGLSDLPVLGSLLGLGSLPGFSVTIVPPSPCAPRDVRCIDVVAGVVQLRLATAGDS